MSMFISKQSGGRWGIFEGTELLEGGFFTKTAARQALAQREAEVPVATEPVAAEPEPTPEVAADEPIISNPDVDLAAEEELAKAAAEAEAINTLIGVEGAVPAVTDTAKARGNKRFTVGSAVDTTVFALGGPNGEPKARPNTLAGALYDELKVNGAGTVSELVDRLNRDGVYERVALKSATLRPYSSVAYWLKTWRKDGFATVVIADAPAEEQVA